MSSHSARSQRTRQQARNRPDKLWLVGDTWHEHKYESPKSGSSVLTGGPQLAQLIAEADAHLVAMRKTVR